MSYNQDKSLVPDIIEKALLFIVLGWETFNYAQISTVDRLETCARNYIYVCWGNGNQRTKNTK